MTVAHTYRIVVDGEVGDWLARYLGVATIDAGNGITTISGSVDDPNELERLARLGVDAVVTNDPRIFATETMSTLPA